VPKFNKLCPFCPKENCSYKFKTWIGLLRHVYREHLKVLSRDRGYQNSWFLMGDEWKPNDLIYIRVYEQRYSKYYDIDIKSPEECEQFLLNYVTDNPSFRGFMKKKKKE
jgi:hypothetical protein